MRRFGFWPDMRERQLLARKADVRPDAQEGNKPSGTLTGEPVADACRQSLPIEKRLGSHPTMRSRPAQKLARRTFLSILPTSVEDEHVPALVYPGYVAGVQPAVLQRVSSVVSGRFQYSAITCGARTQISPASPGFTS
jgi:hypothetical protein